jgi:hypothetical protein
LQHKIYYAPEVRFLSTKQMAGVQFLPLKITGCRAPMGGLKLRCVECQLVGVHPEIGKFGGDHGVALRIGEDEIIPMNYFIVRF